MPSAGKNLTTIIKTRHEIPIIHMYACIGLKLTHSRADCDHDFVSAGEYASSILTSGDTRETLNTSSLKSCIKREVFAVDE